MGKELDSGEEDAIKYMKYIPDIHHRKSIRLKGFDYSQPGGYFITVCTQNRECLFGKIFDGQMVLNDAGEKRYAVIISRGSIDKLRATINLDVGL